MKKKIYLFLLISSVCFGQFPGENIEMLENADLLLKPKAPTLQKYGYDNFYINEKLKKKYACCESFNSRHASLEGREFKVVKITPIEFSSDYILELSAKNGETIYFKYSSMYEHLFPFKFLSKVSKEIYCSRINVTNDKFDGTSRSSTPYVGGAKFIKYVDGEKTTIYFTINETGSTLNVNKKGLILLFQGSEKIEFPDANIDVEASSSGYVYSAFVTLSKEHIDVFLNNKITDNRLYVYDGSFKEEDAELLINYLSCLVE